METFILNPRPLRDKQLNEGLNTNDTEIISIKGYQYC